MVTLVTAFPVTGLMAMQIGNPKSANGQSTTAMRTALRPYEEARKL